GQTASCAFHAPHSGRYRFRATSEGAAPTAVERFAYVGSVAIERKGEHRASLVSDRNVAAPGARVHLALTQPYAKANALLTIAHGRVLKYWVQPLSGTVTEFDLPIQRDWSPGFTLSAVVLDAAE